MSDPIVIDDLHERHPGLTEALGRAYPNIKP